MLLLRATKNHLQNMMGWFPDHQSCRDWGGPDFRFPFTEQSFFEDSRIEAVPSYAYSENGVLLAFGQYYLRAGRCHVSRLAIAPSKRGRGWGSRTLAALIELGSSALAVDQCSLFVSNTNERAARLYERLGFEEVPYPGDAGLVLHGCKYLVAEVQSVRARLSSYSKSNNRCNRS